MKWIVRRKWKRMTMLLDHPGGPLRGQMIVCTWNVRAPWAPKTEVQKFLNKHKISAVGLLETRVRVNNSAKIQKRFGSAWKWLSNYSYSPKGRIWVGWLHQDVELNVVNVHEQYLHSCVHNKNGGFTCFLTIVYGLHSVDSRLLLWSVGCLEVW